MAQDNNDSGLVAVPPVPIAILGFSNEMERGQIATLFTRAKLWERPWHIVEEVSEARVLLMPADTPEERSYWSNYADQFLETRLIAYAKQPFEVAHWHLHRQSGEPPSPLEFTNLLKQIGELLLAQPDDTPRRTIPAEAKDNEPFFDSSIGLVGLLRDILAQDGQFELRGINTPRILVSVPERRYAILAPGTLQQLHPLFELRRDYISLTHLDAAGFASRADDKDLAWWPIEQLIWCAAIRASRGRLPKGYEGEGTVTTLEIWPIHATDFPGFPDYISMAAALHSHILSFDKLAQMTGASMAQVIDFCNACDALGYLSWRTQVYAHNAIEPPLKHRAEDEYLKKIGRRIVQLREDLIHTKKVAILGEL